MSTTDRRRDFLLSIHPQYADKIMCGTKTVELRRRFREDVEADATLMIYSTSPTQAIVGSATISAVRRLALNDLWDEFGEAACIARSAFDSYFQGLTEGFAILLSEPRPLERAVTVSDLKRDFGFVPPQSFMYLRREYYPLLKREHVQAPI